MLRELNSAFEKAINAAPSGAVQSTRLSSDSFYSRSGQRGHKACSGYIVGVVNGLLTQIDRANATPVGSFLCVAASNFADRVDPCHLCAPGRLDHLSICASGRLIARASCRWSGPRFRTSVTAEELDMNRGISFVQQTGATIAMLIRGPHGPAPAVAVQPLELQPCVRSRRPDCRTGARSPMCLHRVAIHEAGHICHGADCGPEPGRVRWLLPVPEGRLSGPCPS